MSTGSGRFILVACHLISSTSKWMNEGKIKWNIEILSDNNECYNKKKQRIKDKQFNKILLLFSFGVGRWVLNVWWSWSSCIVIYQGPTRQHTMVARTQTQIDYVIHLVVVHCTFCTYIHCCMCYLADFIVIDVYFFGFPLKVVSYKASSHTIFENRKVFFSLFPARFSTNR